MNFPSWGPLAALGVMAFALGAWNLAVGLRVSVLPSAPRALRLLSALCAFLVLPAAAISVLATTAPGVRVLGPLAPLWPLVVSAMFVQSVWSAWRGQAHRAVGAAFALYSALAAWIAVVAWIDGALAPLPAWMMAPGFAAASLAARASAALVPWITLAMLPALAPAAPARFPLTRAARGIAAVGVALLLGVIGASTPAAYDTLDGARQLDARGGAPRARGDLAIGMRLFGTLRGAPSGAVGRHDVALADSLGVTAVHVEFSPDGATAAALDSVARALVMRRDTITLVVTLDLDGGAPRGEAGRRARDGQLERIVRRLHPDVLLPAERVPAGVSVEDWQRYLMHAAAVVRRIDPNVTVALATDAATATDSALADWVFTERPAVDAVALVARDATAPRRFSASLNAIARWASFAAAPAGVWVLGVPSAPTATGAQAQAQLLRHATAWSAAQPYVRGIIAGDASDVTAPVALRTAAAKSRLALLELAAVVRLVRDIPSTLPDTLVSARDSLAGTRGVPPDTVTPPSP